MSVLTTSISSDLLLSIDAPIGYHACTHCTVCTPHDMINTGDRDSDGADGIVQGLSDVITDGMINSASTCSAYSTCSLTIDVSIYYKHLIRLAS